MHLHIVHRLKPPAGSFGRVYLGEWQSTSVAVKLLLDSKEAQRALELNLPSPLLAKMEEVGSCLICIPGRGRAWRGR